MILRFGAMVNVEIEEFEYMTCCDGQSNITDSEEKIKITKTYVMLN